MAFIEPPSLFRVYYYDTIQEKWILRPAYHIQIGERSSIKFSPNAMLVTIGASPKPSRSILMRSTETILDRYKRVIFEGDILETIGKDKDGNPYERALVFYKNATFSAHYYSKVPKKLEKTRGSWWGEGWEPNIAQNLFNHSPQTHLCGWKIVGNLLENPELLGYQRTRFVDDKTKKLKIKDFSLES